MKPNCSKKTLDVQHTSRLKDIEEKAKKRDQIKRDIQRTQDKISNLECHQDKDDSQIETLLNLIDHRQNLERDLHNLENECNEIDYYVNTASILFKYYDIVEKGNYDEVTTNNKIIKEQSILKYFMPKKIEEVTESSETIKDDVDDRASLLDKYLSYTDSNYLKMIETDAKDQCTCCGSSNRNVIINDGMIFCNECDTVEYIIVDHDRPSYRDPPKLPWAQKLMQFILLKLHWLV
jgi:hypothetical protein